MSSSQGSKSSRYYPFERNRFFYGKLLTVRDFVAEQNYFIDKRRLMNRLLHGTGVVSGLHVTSTDKKSITVEAGVAIDAAGREIVVPTTTTMDLAPMKYFTNNEYDKNVYLCLQYLENDREKVNQGIASPTDTNDSDDYNRIQESFKLLVKEQPPSPQDFDFTKLLYDIAVLESADAKVRVLVQVPRYVQANETFAVQVRIEKTLATLPVSVQFQLTADPTAPLAPMPSFHYEEARDAREDTVETQITLTAGNTAGEVKLSWQPDSIKITSGDEKLDVVQSGNLVLQVVEEPVQNYIWQDYFGRKLEEATGYPEDTSIYLAKLNLSKNDSSFVIESVEQVPFGEYVYNASLMKQLDEMLKTETKVEHPTLAASASAEWLPAEENSKPQLSVDFDADKQEFEFKLGIPQAKTAPETQKVSTGVAEIKLQPQFKPGLHLFGKPVQRFYSEEIRHRLGTGDVLVMTGVEYNSEYGSPNDSNLLQRVYFGDQDVFAESDFDADMPQMSIGTVVYPNKGTFRIGIKLHEQTDREMIRIRWWAYKTLEQQADAEAGSVVGTEQTLQQAAASQQEEQ